MGYWGNNILDNDTASGVYDDFMEMYVGDFSISEIDNKLHDEYRESLDDPFDSNNFWFALSLAKWEVKILDDQLLEKIKSIVESKKDLENWYSLGSSPADLKKREAVLIRFVNQISTKRNRAKSRESIKIKPIFQKGDCLTFKLENGNFGGAIVLESDAFSRFGFGNNLVAVLRTNNPDLPMINDLKNASILITNYDETTTPGANLQVGWYLPDFYKKCYSSVFKVVGNIDIKRTYQYPGTYFGSAGWHLIKEKADKQFEHEKLLQGPQESISILEWI